MASLTKKLWFFFVGESDASYGPKALSAEIAGLNELKRAKRNALVLFCENPSPLPA